MQKTVRSNKGGKPQIILRLRGAGGTFTAKQAQKAGFCPSSQTYHVREGNWVREHRGIFRLTSFPAALRPELMRWHLWSMDRQGRAQGVYSHHTAFCLYEMPEARLVLHMTVPTSFRRNSATPEGLVLHFADLPESDIAEGEGYRMTGPLRTILDLAAVNTMPSKALSKALLRIVERGLITRDQIRRARRYRRHRGGSWRRCRVGRRGDVGRGDPTQVKRWLEWGTRVVTRRGQG